MIQYIRILIFWKRKDKEVESFNSIFLTKWTSILIKRRSDFNAIRWFYCLDRYAKSLFKTIQSIFYMYCSIIFAKKLINRVWSLKTIFLIFRKMNWVYAVHTCSTYFYCGWVQVWCMMLTTAHVRSTRLFKGVLVIFLCFMFWLRLRACERKLASTVVQLQK